MKSLIKILCGLIIASSSSALTTTMSLIDPSAIDHAVSPCDDFYQYA